MVDSGSQGGPQPDFVARCAIAFGWVEPSCRERMSSSSSRGFSRSQMSTSASSTISASRRIVNSFQVSEVHRPNNSVAGFHQPNQAFDEIVDVAERTRLHAVAVGGNAFVSQCLNDKIRYHAALVGVSNVLQSDGPVVNPGTETSRIQLVRHRSQSRRNTSAVALIDGDASVTMRGENARLGVETTTMSDLTARSTAGVELIDRSAAYGPR